MAKQRKILQSPVEPRDKSWLWLDTKDGVSTLKEYINGKWSSIGNVSSSDAQPAIVPPSADCVTRDELSKTLLSYVRTNSLSSILSNYMLKVDVPDLSQITARVDALYDRLNNYVTAQQLTDRLGLYQRTMSAGLGIQINSNTIALSADTDLNPTSLNALTNKKLTALFAAIDLQIGTLSSAIAAKQDALEPGSGITIDNGVISATGGGGGGEGEEGSGIAVAVVANESAATDSDTLYFFSHSPLQGVGLYNTLLREGSLVGTDGNTYTYSPSALYDVHKDGSFDVIEQDAKHFTTVEDNIVFYNFEDENGDMQCVRTTMHNVGKVIVSKTIKYSDTSDTAYLSFQVSGPFFSEKTRVFISYDSQDVSVYLVKKTTRCTMQINFNGISWFEPDLEEVLSGSYIDFTNDDFYKSRHLIILRKISVVNNVPDYTEFLESLDTTVSFTTDAETLDVSIKYSPTKLLYKDGVVNPMPNIISSQALANFLSGSFRPSNVDPNNPLKLMPQTTGYLAGKSFGMAGTGYFNLVTDFAIDQSKHNVLYVKVVSSDPSRTTLSAGYSSNMLLRARRDGWVSIDSTSTYYTALNGSFQYMFADTRIFGSHVVSCVMQDVNSCGRDSNYSFGMDDEIVLDALQFGIRINQCYHISEIGILTYNDPT